MPLAVIGHNAPPSPIELGTMAAADLSSWLANNPVIQTEDQARDAKIFLDRMRATLGDIEAERVKRVAPLNLQLAEINERYKSVHNTDAKRPGSFDKVLNELKARLGAYVETIEAERRRVADEARRLADEAAQAARDAEQREREAIENAKAGELGVDVTQVVLDADGRFAEFKKAERAAALAERESNVRIGGGWMKSAALRNSETLVLVSYAKAITAMGPNDKIRDAILSAARDYRKKTGSLPEGVISEITRKL